MMEEENRLAIELLKSLIANIESGHISVLGKTLETTDYGADIIISFFGAPKPCHGVK